MITENPLMCTDCLLYTSELPIPVIGEGRVHTPEEAVKMLDMGAWAVIVGGAITRPLEIAGRFMNCLLYTSRCV